MEDRVTQLHEAEFESQPLVNVEFQLLLQFRNHLEQRVEAIASEFLAGLFSDRELFDRHRHAKNRGIVDAGGKEEQDAAVLEKALGHLGQIVSLSHHPLKS